MLIRIPHTPGLFIAAIVVAAQFEIHWFLRHEWKRLLAAHIFRSVSGLLHLIWLAVAIGLFLDLSGLQYDSHLLPPGLSSVFVGLATLWGFTSAIAINAYAVGRYLLRATPACSPARRQTIQTVTAAAMAAPFALAGFGTLIERTRYVVKEVDFPVPNLHPDLEGLRIAQISDLHVSPFLSVREAGRVVDITNELRPQLTLVTGDLITQQGDPLDGTIRELARLKADAGVLGCLGNHEVYAKCEAYATREAAKAGIRFLRQQAAPLRWGNGVLNVAGVDFQSFAARQTYLQGADSLLAPGAANLLMSHNPDVFPAAVRAGYDAVVGGHTHGGQVTVEILNQTANLARFFTPYVAGLYRLEGRSCYVNAGIGTIGMPVRLGAPPEITLLRLRRA